MKKIILTLTLAVLCLAASANEVRYFTYPQMTRTVSYLNAQQELMIWCGYADEIETYCLVNEVWAEKVNSQYYEVWLYGYDAWTGEEIYMPLDLGCIWLQGAGHRFYNAATYLRFRNGSSLPSFYWHIPPYHPYERHHHAPHYACTYHHHVHQPGWHHPHPDHNPHHCHEYYMRDPWAPVYYAPQPYHPGQDRPSVSINQGNFDPRANGGHSTLTSPGTTQPAYRTYSRTSVPASNSGNRVSTPGTSTNTPTSNRSTTGTPSTGRSTTGNSNGTPSRTSTSTGRSTSGNGNGTPSRTSTSTGRSTTDSKASTPSRTSTSTGRSTTGNSNGTPSRTSTSTSTGRSTTDSKASTPSRTATSTGRSTTDSKASTPSRTPTTTSRSTQQNNNETTPTRSTTTSR